MRPIVLEKRKISLEAFEMGISSLYSVVTYLAFAQAIVFTLLAKLIVRIMYGNEFAPTIPVLQIIVWQQAFSIMGSVRNIWILGEEKHSILWIINLCGAMTSILLNLLLIPIWGACGAALASVITQIFTNVIVGFLLKPIRRNNQLLLKGMNPRLMIEMISIAFKK
jgi:O-antigen/teichoic acid export membrane protein